MRHLCQTDAPSDVNDDRGQQTSSEGLRDEEMWDDDTRITWSRIDVGC